MPQSSDDMHELMNFYFKNGGINDHEPMEFLKSQGYTLTSRWFWRKPNRDHYVTLKEELCIRFLIEEWDFGGIQEEQQSAT